MWMKLVLEGCCGGCGATSDLYGSNCKHMTLCSTCGNTMAHNKSKCSSCGVIITRLIREYNVLATTTNDKHYFIGTFSSGLPDFSTNKTSQNKWSLHKDGLETRHLTHALREKYKNEPWLLKDETGQSQYRGHLQGAQSAPYYLLMKRRKDFVAIPIGSWYNFTKFLKGKQLTLEEAEEKMKNRKKTADGYGRWMMKAANSGPAAFGECGGESCKKSEDDDEGHVADKGEEDEENDDEEGLKNGGGDDDEEGPRGGDLVVEDDDNEKGDDWDHEEIYSDDEEAVGIDPEDREGLAMEVPATHKIKQDVDEDDEKGGGLSKPMKELKKLLRRAGCVNESDTEDDDDDGHLKSFVEEENVSAPKSSAPPNVTLSTSSSSSNGGPSTLSSGPVTEEEIRAVLMQKTRVTIKELVAKFKQRLRSSEKKNAFAEILKRISKIQKTADGSKYVSLTGK